MSPPTNASSIEASRPAAPPAQSPSRLGFTLLARLRSLLALAILIAVFSRVSPVFLTWNNLVIMTQHVAVRAVLATGMTFVILTAGIDLSVGAIAALSGVVAGYLLTQGIPLGGHAFFLPAAAVIAVAIASGGIVGAINGFVITLLRVPDFIVTLGMLYVARGAALLITGGSSFIGLGGSKANGNIGFDYVGTARWFHLPVQIFVMIAVGIVGAFTATRTIFGRHVYAVGGNMRAAISAGIRVRRIKITVYALSGACAGIAGVMLASELSAADPTAATNYELGAIAAVVLGGTSLFGGQGSVAGSIAGAFVIGFLNDGLVLANVSEFWQMIATGLVIVVAVGIDEFQRLGSARLSARRRLRAASGKRGGD
ncbi:MAG TPA: ABC transporter permease [Acetobacteraceae bacterium]|nr:ABC transporter permease [Acetobacteraceae bacterium]